MPYISEDKINEVKDQIDIVNLISEYIDLKQSGSNYIGLCPFHNEKTPSFTVSSQKRIFHCFGCGEGGDAISFIMKKENLSYPEAIQFLADKLGIFLETGKVDKELYEHRKILYAINNEAKLYFFHNLLTNTIPKKYIKERGLDRTFINKYMIGYATGNAQGLLNHLLKKGYKVEDMIELGLVKKSSKSNSLYDAFRNRLIFPITDIRKNIIGFGGRTLVDDRAKYINSPESLIYHKSNNIYGVGNLQNASKKNKIILVEGYMDVISLSNNGIDYCVASLGTALTKEQAKLISRYSKNIYICYDGDDAGIKAAERAMEIFAELNINPYIVQIPDGLDPDDYVKKYGKNAFDNLLENSLNPILYKYRNLLNSYNLKDIDQKVEFLEKLAKLLSDIESKLTRDEYISRFSKDLDIDNESLLQEVDKISNNMNKKDTSNLLKVDKKIYNSNKTNMKLKLIESLRFVLFNNPIANRIIEESDFLKNETKYWTLCLEIIQNINLNDDLKHQIQSLNLDSDIEKIFNKVLKIKDFTEYTNIDSANKYINSLRVEGLIYKRDELKEQFSLLEENENLTDDLKIVYSNLAMDILKLNKEIKKFDKN
ncbi:DNA primase [Miniphocaeibacter massiliensis]|uniref:DNA primase n=1 Tax=Miniphocaeibacter massiliensis TaxID=2041841 RepID=UPI000C083BB2|nr:DNA primase [Miniphocaeibacter massiliensis]